jgi:hypothetical protein
VGQEIMVAPLASEQVAVEVDSGLVENTGSEPAVVFSTTVTVPDTLWLRLNFHKVLLAGDVADGTGSYLQITSVADGAVQFMHAQHIVQWRNTSAYFNGDSVQIEVMACPNTGPNQLVMTQVTAGVRGQGDRSICGPTDDRELSDDPRAARALPVGCSAWIIDDCNHCLLTAGHCFGLGDIDVVEFNVPLSDAEGGLNHPPPEDQYAVDASSIHYVYGGVGNDWGYFGCFPNSNTDLTPFEAQGDCFNVVQPYPVSGDIRITGYGTVSSPVPPEWNQVQKTHVGPYWDFFGTTLEYQTDTTGGNSGSPVIYEDTGEAIGIHTHGGCSSSDGNSGTGANNAGLQAALADPRGVCIPLGLEFSYPDGLPELVSPAGGTTVRVEVSSGGEYIPEPGTGQFHYDIGDGFVTVEMEEVSENVYDAVFPADDCGDEVLYYFSAEAVGGETFTDPRNAPDSFYSVDAAYGVIVFFEDDFETDQGWSVSGDATTGHWERGVPVGGGDRGDPPTDYDGSGQCYLTGNTYGDSDVDDGYTYLHSPTIDLSAGDALINYALWYTNNYGNDPNNDLFKTYVSNDDGANWVLAETIGPVTSEGWAEHSFRVGDFVPPTDRVRVRFEASDLNAGSVVEAGIDAFQVMTFDCESPCPGDADGDGDTDQADLGILLTDWGCDDPGNGCAGDLNGDDKTDQADLGILLTDWGCGT